MSAKEFTVIKVRFGAHACGRPWWRAPPPPPPACRHRRRSPHGWGPSLTDCCILFPQLYRDCLRLADYISTQVRGVAAAAGLASLAPLPPPRQPVRLQPAAAERHAAAARCTAAGLP